MIERTRVEGMRGYAHGCERHKTSEDVAQVKGVIATRCEAEIVDLSHDFAPWDVFEGAFFLRDAIGSLRGDRQVIVVAVVDPGVGSSRRLLAACDGNVTLLGPDNGLLSLALRESAIVHAIANEALFLPGGTSTFHGRDRLGTDKIWPD